VLWFTVDGFFWFPRRLLGIERHLYAFYDQPELMHRINSDLAEWILLVIDQVCAVCAPDFMTFDEDMSYNNGPMLSKELFDAFMRPYYDRVIPVLRDRGIIPIIDSDGDVTIPAYWFAEAGLDGILPLERQAGVDIALLRNQHPKMKFIGHFDKMTMNKGTAAMRTEFERLLPTAARGGFLISCDHQTPPGVSYRDYQSYLTLFREYAQRAGDMSQARAREGWTPRGRRP
jgi:uroporphyrinogen-III decarboxylase